MARVLPLFAGCAATRPISDVAFGAGGAYLGHEISNGDPLVTAAGAASGVIVSETLHYAAKKQSGEHTRLGCGWTRPRVQPFGASHHAESLGTVQFV